MAGLRSLASRVIVLFNLLMRYDQLPTEKLHPATAQLDQFSIAKILRTMNQEDHRAVRAVQKASAAIEEAVGLIRVALADGKRLFFVGAGTSGRLGVLEAAECPPTFHTPVSLIQAFIAGGRSAVFASKEGAEDNRSTAKRLMQRMLHPGDVVVGLTASGVTPFVSAALSEAVRRKATTVLVSCNLSSPILASVRILLDTGAEILSGSTRLKAATATKLVLNQLTLASMVQLGKTYGNRMIDVRPTSRKLRARALSILCELTGCSKERASKLLRQAHSHVKIAALMQLGGMTDVQAQTLLSKTQGSLRRALSDVRLQT